MKSRGTQHRFNPDEYERWTSERLCSRIEELSEQKLKASLELREHLGLPKPPISFDETRIRAPVDDERIRRETAKQMQYLRDRGLVDR